MTPQEEALLAMQISDVKAAVAAVHARIDKHAERADRNFGEVKARQDHTNSRLSKNERAVAMLKGGLYVIAAGLPFVLFALQRLFEH